MAAITGTSRTPTAEELERMHTIYRQGGAERHMAPHIVYADPACPHGCGQHMQAIDFRLDGPAVHDPLVRAWWKDAGFAGRCPRCGCWIHLSAAGLSSALPAVSSCYRRTSMVP